MTIPVPQISSSGVTAPAYADILTALQDDYKSIYGSDIVLDPSTKDGQWLAIVAQGFYDTGQAVVDVYNSFSPLTAQGAGLSTIVKINGISRKSASSSTAQVTVTGVAGTTITSGLVGDNASLGTVWALPASVSIPEAGSVTVTATCVAVGATAAAVGTLTKILTPTFGWQTVTNATAATPGLPLETDASLRQRQALSTSISAVTPLEAIRAAILNCSGVGRVIPYVNNTGSTDANGLPANSVTFVVENGTAQSIIDAIGSKIAPGIRTNGATSGTYLDPAGISTTIHFQPLTLVTVNVAVTIKGFTGYRHDYDEYITSSIAAYISGLGVGTDSYLTKLYGPANLGGDAATGATGLTQAELDVISSLYTVTAMTQAIGAGTQLAQDLVIGYNQAAVCVASTNVTLTVTS